MGLAADLWKSWGILYELEWSLGNVDAAAPARQKAVEAYLAYRRAGGESRTTGAQLCAATGQAIAEGRTDQARAELHQLLQRPDLPASVKSLIPALQAILDGSRDPALGEDPDLDYRDAAEILLLVEHLPPPAPPAAPA